MILGQSLTPGKYPEYVDIRSLDPGSEHPGSPAPDAPSRNAPESAETQDPPIPHRIPQRRSQRLPEASHRRSSRSIPESARTGASVPDLRDPISRLHQPDAHRAAGEHPIDGREMSRDDLDPISREPIAPPSDHDSRDPRSPGHMLEPTDPSIFEEDFPLILRIGERDHDCTHSARAAQRHPRSQVHR